MMYRYVIVEDNPIVRQGVEFKMQQIGYRFELAGTAENGRDGYRLIASEKPDLAIIDMKMPDIDGVALLSMLMSSEIDVQIIVISGYSDFEYAHASIRAGAASYLLKPFTEEELREALDIVQDKLDKQQLDRTHVEREREIETLSKFLYAIPVRSENPSFTHLNIPADNPLFIVAEARVEVGAWRIQSKHSFQELLTIIPFSLQRTRLLIGCTQAGAMSDPSAEMLRIAGKEALSLGVSQPVNSPEQLHCAWQQARQARLLCPIGAGGRHIWQDNLLAPQMLPAKLTEQLMTCLDMQDTIWFEKHLFEYYRCCQGVHMTYAALLAAIRDFFQKALAHYDRAASKQRVSLPTYAQFDHICTHCDDDDMLIHNLISFLSSGFSDIAEQPPGGDSILAIRQYIDTHYTEDLSLECVADMFRISPGYLSRSFSRYMDMSFSEYLTLLRVERAKALLIDGEMDISNIAFLSGFNSDKYFFRVFKRLTGLTPQQYRKRRD